MKPALWRVPLLLALLSGVGLLSALLGDGAWDALSWIALTVPLVTIGWFVIGRRGRKPGA